jgi:hypothetical protein
MGCIMADEQKKLLFDYSKLFDKKEEEKPQLETNFEDAIENIKFIVEAIESYEPESAEYLLRIGMITDQINAINPRPTSIELDMVLRDDCDAPRQLRTAIVKAVCGDNGQAATHMINIKHPWEKVTASDVEAAIEGTILAPIVAAFRAPMKPELPIAIALPKALALAGCALSYKSEDRYNIGSGAQLAKVCINTSSGQVPLFYTLIVVESGGGKDVGRVATQLATTNGWNVGDGGSAEGIADALMEKPNGLIMIREMMPWLDKTHWQHKAASFLTGVFNENTFKVQLSQRSKTAPPPRESDFCAPSIISNIQPKVLERFATREDLDSGFLGRFLISTCPAHDGRPTCSDYSDKIERAQNALEVLKTKAGRITVSEDYLQDVFDYFKHNNAMFPSTWKRIVNEYGPRMALLLSIPENDKTNAVRITDDGWARSVVLIYWFYSNAINLLKAADEDPEVKRTESLIRRIFAYISENPHCRTADISRYRGHGSTATERKNAVDEMLVREMIYKDDFGGYVAK